MNLIVNKQLTKKNFDKIFSYIFEKYNATETIKILESLKLLGAVFSTKGGLSLSLSDLRIINKEKKIRKLLYLIENLKVNKIESNLYNNQKINDIWNSTNNLLKTYILSYIKSNDPNNQLLIVLESGARGSPEQIHQLVGLRSLMVDQQGNVVPFPIKKSFIDGLSVFEYLLSSFGARKGIVDTALKTADSGYLTRRLIESSYEIKIVSKQCINKKTFSCIKYTTQERRKLIVIKNSVLSCSFSSNLCQKCFGIDYSTRRLVSLGENIGILSAHSISEPSTQLTMRTFHTGGIFMRQQTLIDTNNISGFAIIDKKKHYIQIIDWKNKMSFLSREKKITDKFFAKKHQLALTNFDQEDKGALPIFIAIISKNLTKINLIKNKYGLFFENLLYHLFEFNETDLIFDTFLNDNFKYFYLNVEIKYFFEYFFNQFIFLITNRLCIKN